MTTIAWDGETLAADTCGSAGGFCFSNIKAYRLSNGNLYAGSGSAEECEAVRLWLENGGDKPVVKDYVGLLIENRRCYRLEDKLIKFEITDTFHAVGSGRDYAIAAMHLGKCAREAIELACIYDIYTAKPITEIAA